MSIGTTIKSIQDIMRKDVGVDGDAQRIGQLVWMFVAKVSELMALCDRLKADLATASHRQATLADTLIESALEAT